MKREINLQKLRILIAYAVLGLVVSFEWHFVYSGIMALPVLNGVIIAVFFTGNILIWKSLASLRHETAALELIAEAYTDTHSGEVTDEVRAARRQRCLKKGTLFRQPKLIGPAFSLLMDEFWRSRSLRFRLDTVQMLMATVEHKMARDRGLIAYVSGLAIFLGLIGTFIGLMEMVQSVGGIIGSLAGANASPESIQNLIKALQAPLTGMSQGFSASLFGLFTSLTLGLIGRFANSASYSVKEHFESWLTSVSQMEQVRRNDGRAQTRAASHDGAPALPAAAIADDKVASALSRAADAQLAQARELETLAERFKAVAINHGALQEVLRRTDTLADEMNRLRKSLSQENGALRAFTEDAFATLRQAIGEEQAQTGFVQSELEALRTAFDERLDATDRRFGEFNAAQRAHQAAFEGSFEEAARARDAFAADMSARQADLVANMRRMEAKIAMAPDPSLIGSSIRGVLLEGFNDIARRLEDATQAAVHTAAVQPQPVPDAVIGEIRELARSLETSLAQGLGDVAGSFRDALDLYVTLMRQVQPERPRVEAPLARDAG